MVVVLYQEDTVDGAAAQSPTAAEMPRIDPDAFLSLLSALVGQCLHCVYFLESQSAPCMAI